MVIDSGTAIGTLAKRDVMNCIGEGHNIRECPVAKHMRTPIVSVEATADALVAASLLMEKGMDGVPVIAGSDLLGIVSLSDVANVFAWPIATLLSRRTG